MKVIENIPTLYFLDPTLEITLETDASDYGIGAVLYQTDGLIKKPIRFLSKSLTPVQHRWTVIEK